MHGLYVMWWVQERHLSPAAVAAVLAAGDLAITVIEVPTGWFADRFGARVSLIAGSAVQVAGMLCCWLGADLRGLIGATLLVAAGDGFRSGADQALLFRSCAALDRQSEFQRIEAATHSVGSISLVCLVLAGGAIVGRWGFDAGWFVETAVSAAGLLIACVMVEPGVRLEDKACARLSCESEGATDAASETRWNLRALLAIAAPAAFLSAAATALTFYAQTVGGEPGRMTRLVAAITLLEAAGAVAAARLPPPGAGGQMLVVVCGVAVSAAVTRLLGVWPAIGVLSFLLGVMHPLRAAAIQRLARDEMRARAASVASACDKVCDTVALVLAGQWRRPRA
jgi:hypothetical protein